MLFRSVSVDMETGLVNLADDSLCQKARSNWKTAPAEGDVFKFAMGSLVGKKKRGRPRKDPVEAPKPVVVGTDGQPVKKKRGRPPGSKNRSKAEIRAAKVAAVAARAARRSRVRA